MNTWKLRIHTRAWGETFRPGGTLQSSDFINRVLNLKSQRGPYNREVLNSD